MVEYLHMTPYRPSYMPRWLNVRVVPPELVLGFFVVMLPFALAALILEVVEGSVLGTVGFVLFFGFLVTQALIYAPRAWSAHQAGESGWDLRWNNPFRR